jgi:hypothetical protein
MRRISQVLFGALLLLLAVQAGAQTTTTAAPTTTTAAPTTTTTTLPAVSWNVIQNGDCTANVAATGLTTAQVDCCTTLGQGFCNARDTNGGTSFGLTATFASGTGVIYTSGGNSLSAVNLAKIPLQNIKHVFCGQSTAGRTVVWKPTTASGKRAPKFLLYNSGGTEVSGSVANEAFQCEIIGY